MAARPVARSQLRWWWRIGISWSVWFNRGGMGSGSRVGSLGTGIAGALSALGWGNRRAFLLLQNKK